MADSTENFKRTEETASDIQAKLRLWPAIVLRCCFVTCIATLFSSMVSGSAFAQATAPPSNAEIRALGLEARLNPKVRNGNLQQLANLMESLSPEQVHELQGAFQYALLLQCDPEIISTLDPVAIKAVDKSLEGLFDLDKIARDTHWEPLIYAYGFFNRDVSPEQITAVLSRWESLSDKEKSPLNPTYIHVIDAVCKPLVAGELSDRATTRQALEIVLPALKDLYSAPAKSGTFFHAPSHGCLILGPLYDRWIHDDEFGPLITQHLGDRAAFERLLASQLIGVMEKETPLPRMESRYYFYIGSYLSNTLARLNARSALPALERSLEIYKREKVKGQVMKYTQRALLALGNETARAEFEEDLKDAAKQKTCIKTLVWLCRNGRGETKAYGEEKLGALFECNPEEALRKHFELELMKLRTQ